MDKIGKLLKDKRETLSLTFDAVNASTRIPLKFLAALEDDNVSGFPAETYYFGSLRRYARFLGLDDNALVEAYKKEKLSNIKQVVPLKQETCSTLSAKFWLVFILSVVLITLGAFLWLNFKIGQINNGTYIKPVVKIHIAPCPPQAKQPTKKIQSLTVPVQKAKKTVETKNKGLTLEIEAVDSSWVKVTSDGKVQFSTTLEKGLMRQWTADKKFELVVGYAPGVRVKLNGKNIDVRSSAKKDINELTLTEENAR